MITSNLGHVHILPCGSGMHRSTRQNLNGLSGYHIEATFYLIQAPRTNYELNAEQPYERVGTL